MKFLKKLFGPKKIETTPEMVGEFYNEHNDSFLKVYGEVIQAFRTNDVTKLLDYQIEAMELKPGMKVVDAGCGVCGPAVYFAKHAGVEVHAVTISQEQFDKSKERIAEAGMEEKVFVYHGDYHKLQEILGSNDFDRVYFLESFGHSPNHSSALDSAWNVLKPGGYVYIKDLFQREPLLPEHIPAIEREVAKINEAYRYNIPDLYSVLKHLRKEGWILSKLKTIDLPIADFENLTISNEFQELTGIAKIEGWDDYVFPVDFFELLCIKPEFDLSNGLNKYFLQNLMYMKVHNKKEEEL
ncbi:MAG: cyclopropane fatty-acyl-phospholipid synthase-like methyltransferase [Bacteroidia bacterium]|jgi:cyclopropane fatty-acyl-phospholipid synthase-like methyltransferase